MSKPARVMLIDRDIQLQRKPATRAGRIATVVVDISTHAVMTRTVRMKENVRWDGRCTRATTDRANRVSSDGSKIDDKQKLELHSILVFN